jgi:Uncharacterized protein conserved in bacteria
MRVLVRIAIGLGMVVLGQSNRAVAQVPASLPAAAAPAPAVDPAKLALIRDVLTQTHAVDLMFQSMQAAVPMQRAANPAIPAVFWDRFIAAAHEREGDLETMFIQIYDHHFTADELRQLLAFYHTPIGQKLLAEQPALAQEAMAAGQQWGRRLGLEVGQKLTAEAQKAP